MFRYVLRQSAYRRKVTQVKQNERRLLSLDEVLETVLPISRSTLYTEIRAGRLPVVKIGRRTFVSNEAVEQYIADLSDQPRAL